MGWDATGVKRTDQGILLYNTATASDGLDSSKPERQRK